ncbi:TPA: hypothetical protein PXN82_004388 [Yersinia enterocolitica]|nr:hypothetical protein [Yersinia enterocolitica]HDL7472545.1 hypothetical protein [Yersinia enterocolitica]
MENNDSLLPTRDFLRQLIGQSFIKQNELRELMRGRGVFNSSDEKKLIGSTLIKTGISALEYIELRETYKSKEENPKLQTRQIEWSSDSSLIEAIDDSITGNVDFNSFLENDFGTLKLASAPMFSMIDQDPNHIEIEFNIERFDFTKNWGENKTIHHGYVELKKEDGNVDVVLTLCHTSKEVRDFGDKIAKKIINDFKEKNYIKSDAKTIFIRFHDFDNNGRVKFLRELSCDLIDYDLYFKDTIDLQFSPDALDDKTPNDLKWMKDRIEDLKLKGKGIQSTFFFSQKEYHKYIKLYKLACDYTFSNSNYDGTCRINFEFPDINNINSELNVEVINLNISTNEIGIQKNELKNRLLRILDAKKINLYEKYHIRKTPAQL